MVHLLHCSLFRQAKSLPSYQDKIALLLVTATPPHTQKKTNMSKVGKRRDKDKKGWRCCVGRRCKRRERSSGRRQEASLRLSTGSLGVGKGSRLKELFFLNFINWLAVRAGSISPLAPLARLWAPSPMYLVSRAVSLLSEPPAPFLPPLRRCLPPRP